MATFPSVSLESVGAQHQLALKAVFHFECRLANGSRNIGTAKGLAGLLQQTEMRRKIMRLEGWNGAERVGERYRKRGEEEMKKVGKEKNREIKKGRDRKR